MMHTTSLGVGFVVLFVILIVNKYLAACRVMGGLSITGAAFWTAFAVFNGNFELMSGLTLPMAALSILLVVAFMLLAEYHQQKELSGSVLIAPARARKLTHEQGEVDAQWCAGLFLLGFGKVIVLFVLLHKAANHTVDNYVLLHGSSGTSFNTSSDPTKQPEPYWWLLSPLFESWLVPPVWFYCGFSFGVTLTVWFLMFIRDKEAYELGKRMATCGVGLWAVLCVLQWDTAQRIYMAGSHSSNWAALPTVLIALFSLLDLFATWQLHEMDQVGEEQDPDIENASMLPAPAGSPEELEAAEESAATALGNVATEVPDAAAVASSAKRSTEAKPQSIELATLVGTNTPVSQSQTKALADWKTTADDLLSTLQSLLANDPKYQAVSTLLSEQRGQGEVQPDQHAAAPPAQCGPADADTANQPDPHAAASASLPGSASVAIGGSPSDLIDLV